MFDVSLDYLMGRSDIEKPLNDNERALNAEEMRNQILAKLEEIMQNVHHSGTDTTNDTDKLKSIYGLFGDINFKKFFGL